MELTAAAVRQNFTYDPDEGVLRWRVGGRGRGGGPGGAVGCRSNGKLQTTIQGKSYQVHRLIWIYMTGEWPRYYVDHINGNALDNRWSNLRDATPSVNAQNIRGPKSSSGHGYLGVHKNHGMWRATITLEGTRYHIGHYKTPEEAHAAYLDVKRLFHEGCTI